MKKIPRKCDPEPATQVIKDSVKTYIAAEKYCISDEC
jgi:hypothetical protein